MRVRSIAAGSMMAFGLACSGDDTLPAGAGGTSVAMDGAIDAIADRGTGGSAGTESDVTISDSRSGSEDVRDATPRDGGDGSTRQDTRDSSSVPIDAATDADSDVEDAAPADDRADADAKTCRRPSAPDASADAAGLGTITNLMGYTASDVLYVTWNHPAGSVPRNRILELRFDPSPGVCAVTLAGRRAANASQLRVFLMRANYLMFGMLPTFFAPGTYPLNENVYEQDAGIATIAEVDIVTTDGTCSETYYEASGGNVTLTSVTPSRVAGSFTATFADAGTVSGGFEVDLCFDAELPECPSTCTP